jgi:hypothetical protein
MQNTKNKANFSHPPPGLYFLLMVQPSITLFDELAEHCRAHCGTKSDVCSFAGQATGKCTQQRGQGLLTDASAAAHLSTNFKFSFKDKTGKSE